MCSRSGKGQIRRRLADFYDAPIDARLPEATRLAETIQTWWPAILVALGEDASNVRTEGFKLIIFRLPSTSSNEEASEFQPTVIEALRTPLKSCTITLGRSEVHARYPARFQLIMVANPCPAARWRHRALIASAPRR
jgi:Magnesium chelatase, subunit ChlI